MMRRVTIRTALSLVLAGVLVQGCDTSRIPTPDDAIRARLVGTWLRTVEDNGTRVRRVLVLEADGKFREMVSIVEPGAAALRKSHLGEWLFDGTNLKRRYTSIDGEPVRAPAAPFATFALAFPSENEFVGTDFVHKREVRYRRVEAGTRP